jgi:hypothetical protein
MLEKEFKYFLDNKAQLIKKYNDLYVVIVGGEIVGAYKTEIEAYEEAQKEHKLGSFLIQFCSEKDPNAIQTFHSRVQYN